MWDASVLTMVTVKYSSDSTVMKGRGLYHVENISGCKIVLLLVQKDHLNKTKKGDLETQ